MQIDMVISDHQDFPWKVWVIELLLEYSGKSIFALEITTFKGENDHFFSSGGKVVMLTQDTLVPFLEKNLDLDLGGVSIEKLVSLRLDIEGIYRFLDGRKRIDCSDSILNFLNFSFDFLTAIGDKLSVEQQYLEEFADFLTFSKSAKKFLRERKISKSSFIKDLDFLNEKIKANCHCISDSSQIFELKESKINSRVYLGVLRPFLTDREIDINDLRS